jgi:hypothetical protein
MLPDPKVKCPATGFARACREILAECDCPKFVRITGMDPNTGQPVDKVGCSDSFIPMLLIENSQQQRQTAAAIESMRNALVQLRGAELEQLQALGTMLDGSMRVIDGKGR